MTYLQKSTKRALRRDHVQRLKNNRKNYWGYGRAYGQDGTSVMSPKQLSKVVQYPKNCSCPMCGNERKHFHKRTLQELKQLQILKENL